VIAISIDLRLEHLKHLEKSCGAPVITYVTSDRQGLTTRIANDAVRIIHSHLEAIGKRKEIDLFLYTTGGVLMAPVRLVHLFREYCDVFKVLVPHRALSAGSLLCLGADEIVMAKLAELSPVDPSTANAFNPQDPLNPPRRIPISVEDVRAYHELAREQAGLKSEDKMLEVFRSLTSQINPIALGNVHRVYSEIRTLVRNLLSIHMTSEEDKLKIPEIVKDLTQQYTHDYPICRTEAEKLGLKVKRPDKDLEFSMMNLFRDYEKDLKLQEPFNPDALLKEQESCEFRFETAYIESDSRSDAFIQEGVIRRQPQAPPPPKSPIPGVVFPPISPVMITFTSQKWEQIR
jgi:hypothetical protein